MLTFLRRHSTFAVACPGQGIVSRGCLSSLKSFLPYYQHVLDCVDDTLGEHFSAHLLAEPPKKQNVAMVDPWSSLTANAQPAIVTATYVIYELLRRLHGVDLAHHPRVSYILGHSLGEYSALLLGGVLSLESTIKIVRQRGLLMQQLVKETPYGMKVLIFRPASFSRVIEVAKQHNVLACINNATQISVSGYPHDLEKALDAMNDPKRVILKSVDLPVNIPFHNALLAPIESTLAKLPSELQEPSKPIVSNVTGRVSQGDVYLNTVRANSQPVDWKGSMEFIESQNVTGIVNLGPGDALDAINSRFKLVNYPLKSAQDMEHLARSIG
ncbi:putative [acyl-carrier-protein] S-malonyltransferase [Clavispora lusitaniae]|uniref:[acyl-carrier-protein] S-malonyltransferase n=1 Tax=Clavispora lusitaniae TaxID=36911 RepID=A0AA91SZF6_CLALS|nr:putative [acyl-carrier-protein] S-malonyltransferase [Clavispora lusitaniae]